MQINKINSNSFTGSLVLPAIGGDTITIDKDSVVNIHVSELDNDLTCVQSKCSFYCSQLETVPIPIDKVLTAYTAATLAPDDTEIDLSLYA